MARRCRDEALATREVKGAATSALQVPADYSQLGELLIVQLVIALALPFTAILISLSTRFRSA